MISRPPRRALRGGAGGFFVLIISKITGFIHSEEKVIHNYTAKKRHNVQNLPFYAGYPCFLGKKI